MSKVKIIQKIVVPLEKVRLIRSQIVYFPSNLGDIVVTPDMLGYLVR